MILRRRYGTPGMIALPYFLTFEFFGPLMEAAAWIAFPIGLALGIVDYHLVAAFIFCSWVLGSLVTLVACGLEEHGYRNYRRGRDLGRMMCLAVFENMWFRQLIDLYRLAGMYDIARRKQGWGDDAPHRLPVAVGPSSSLPCNGRPGSATTPSSRSSSRRSAGTARRRRPAPSPGRPGDARSPRT